MFATMGKDTESASIMVKLLRECHSQLGPPASSQIAQASAKLPGAAASCSVRHDKRDLDPVPSDVMNLCGKVRELSTKSESKKRVWTLMICFLDLKSRDVVEASSQIRHAEQNGLLSIARYFLPPAPLAALDPENQHRGELGSVRILASISLLDRLMQNDERYN
jgi:hypothetical protein